MKNIIFWMLFGGFLCAGLFSWTAPKLIAWYFESPVEIGVNCRPAVEWSMRNLQKAQLAGFASGVVAAGGVMFALRKKRKLPE